jgi:glutaredoxin
MTLRVYPALLFIVCLVCFVPAAKAEILSYVDESGAVHYVEDASRIPDAYRANSTAPALPHLGKVPARIYAPMAGIQTAGASHGGVELYVTSWCPYCKKLEQFLKSNNVRYTRYDIEASDDAARRYRQIGRAGVPLLKVGSRVIAGYNPDDLAFLIRH